MYESWIVGVEIGSTNTLYFATLFAAWTVFAPTDTAFDEALEFLGIPSLANIPIDVLTDVLLYHVVSGKKYYSDDLAHRCGHLLEMASGKSTRTICRDGHLFQKGGGNADSDLPKVITADIEVSKFISCTAVFSIVLSLTILSIFRCHILC